jgi:nanoRNase/pAp phosphatase (c-di-AMP/oligoRNAs hydrolase)
MDEQQSQLVAKLKESKNVLVTVSKDPSVDQLAAAIGLTVALNRMDKHATAVYSGTTPSTIEFLRPEATLEKTTDSLRDFIIALDKSKADKLRYKVEDQVVRIFITPYHTAISEKDLDFSQGDFNVDLVVALGVQTQQDIDEAVQAHGRILHDAVVASLSTGEALELGSINWVQPDASSLSEMTLALIEQLDHAVLDGQVATALLTGIVAMTERFSNERTSPRTMSASATLMAAGANQQLITSELEAPPEPEPEPEPEEAPEEPKAPEAEEERNDPPEPGTLEIEHEEGTEEPEAELPKPADESFVPNFEPEPEPEPTQPQIHVDDDGHLHVLDKDGELPAADELPKPEIKRERLTEPPAFDNKLSANTEVEAYSPPTEELVKPKQDTPILSHDEHVLAPPADQDDEPPTSNEPDIDTEDKTLSDIEQEVNSPHLHATDGLPVEPLDDARDAVKAALGSTPETPGAPEPVIALNAQPLGEPLHYEALENEPSAPAPEPSSAPTPNFVPAPDLPSAPPSSPSAFPGTPVVDPEEAGKPAPPPVPPPLIPPAG